MNTLEFLSYLQQLDINLTVEGERLSLNAPKGVLTPELQQQIVERKTEILKVLAGSQKASADRFPSIARADRNQAIPLSVAQERLWSSNQLLPDSPLYNMYLAFRLRGALDINALEQALAEIVRRHEILHTRFHVRDGQPVQVVMPYQGWQLPVQEPNGTFEADQDAALHDYITEAISTPFDLSADSLLRVKLLRLRPEDHILTVVIHHITADGWSWTIFLRELKVLYEAFCDGRPSPLPDSPIQYADYAIWQQNVFRSGRMNGQLDYWRQQLGGLAEELVLPGDQRHTQSYVGARQSLTFPAELSHRLKSLSQQTGTTLFVTLLAAFKTLLYRYSGQEDMVIGSPIACRNQVEVQNTIGYFNNIILLRSHLSDQLRFRDVLAQVHQISAQAYDNGDVPFHKVAELPELARLSLVRCLFAFQDDAARRLELAGVQVTPIDVYNGTANFDLFMSVEDSEGTLKAVVEYKPALFNTITVSRLLDNYSDLLQIISTDPDISVADLPSLNSTEQSPTTQVFSNHRRGTNPVPPRTPLEKQLVGIWEEILQVTPVGVNDNFFDLGGHSLLALHLFSRIERDLGVDLPLAVLLQNATIAHLAKIIDHKQDSISWSSIVPIQPVGTKPPFFGVHGMAGNVLFWRSIAEYLGTDQPFYGLQAQGIDGLTPASTSIPDMAAHYIRELRAVQPHGPYLLGGYSMGGEVAFEMACQLAAEGEKTALLAMFDTSNPARPIRPSQVSPSKKGVESHQSNKMTHRLDSWRRKLGGHLERLSRLTLRQKLMYIGSDILKRFDRAYTSGRVRFYHRSRKPLPPNLRIKYLSQSHTQAVFNYIPAVCPAEITMFRARASLESNPIDSPVGWKPLAGGGLKVYIFDSTHRIVDPEFVEEVGSKLQACIQEALEKSTAPPVAQVS